MGIGGQRERMLLVTIEPVRQEMLKSGRARNEQGTAAPTGARQRKEDTVTA